VTYSRAAVVLAATTLAIARLASIPCFADEPAKPQKARQTVAVLDLSSIFKESKQFKDDMEKMKADVTKAEENVKKERDKIKAERDAMEKLPAGSEDYAKKEEYLSKVEAALAASLNLQKGTFLKREAALYLNFYKRIEAEVDAYAKEKGIDIVLRTNNDPVDANKPDSVLTHINRPIVWTSPDLDITSIIAERLEKHKDSPNADKK
jgi:Skp family chaperone for outer membrane proteins